MQPKIFIEEIKQLNTYGKFLVSFDVTSLFKKICLEVTINMAIDTIFENFTNIKFTRKELQKANQWVLLLLLF